MCFYSATENYFGLKAEIQHITIDIYADRKSVCEAIEEEVTEMVPDPNAPLVEVTKTKITWKCPESLLAEVEG
jgi:hypothetical protein